MNGPEHYREAERLLVRAQHFSYGDGGDPVTGNALATEALAHAQLAAVAAHLNTKSTPEFPAVPAPNDYRLVGEPDELTWKDVIQ